MQVATNKEENPLLSFRSAFRKFYESKGALFITWGWIISINYILEYIKRSASLTFLQQDAARLIPYVLIAFGVGVSIYTLRKRYQQRTYKSESLKYVRITWVALLFAMVVTNLSIQKVIGEINFELQHPILMVLIALAIVSTGGILRSIVFVIGGLIFGLAALIAASYPLTEQILIEGIAWGMGMAIPAHVWNRKA